MANTIELRASHHTGASMIVAAVLILDVPWTMNPLYRIYQCAELWMVERRYIEIVIAAMTCWFSID